MGGVARSGDRDMGAVHHAQASGDARRLVELGHGVLCLPALVPSHVLGLHYLKHRVQKVHEVTRDAGLAVQGGYSVIVTLLGKDCNLLNSSRIFLFESSKTLVRLE